MKLSICLMVKDEEKNLERCLNSIRSLTKNIDSELIIVDTGSKDRTVEIAKNFTDKVYFHPWNNNFSEMRNITLSYALGEWIFVIDADEEVVDTTALLKFLEVGDKDKKVGACAVSVRNILREDNDSPQESEFISPRIFRNTKDLKYKGAVHNLPIYTGKLIHLDLILNHYGYISTDKELMEKKYQRTKTLLEQELTKDPQNIYYRFQLSVTYSMHKDKDDALIHANKAYDLIKEKGLDPKRYIYIYSHLASLYFDFGNLVKAEQFCIEGLELEREHLDLHLYLAKIKQINNDVDSAIIHYQEYLNLADHFQKLEVRKNQLIVFNLVNKYTETALDLAELYCNLARYDKATTLLTKLNLNELPDQRHIKIFVKSFMNSGEFQKLKALYTNQNVKDKVLFQIIMENNYRGLNLILKRKFLICFSDNYENDDYLKLQKLRFLFSNSHGNEIHELLIKFADTYDFNSGLDIYGEILYYLFKLFIPIEKILNKVTEVNILKYLDFLRLNFGDFTLIISHYTRTMETSNSISGLRTFKILYKFLLDVLETQGDFNSTFFNYLYFGLKYIKRIYHDEIIKSEMTVALKNNEDSFLVYLSLALEHDKDQRASFLRKAINFYPEMARGVELLLDDEFLAWTQEKELKAQLNILMGLQEYDSINQVIEEYKLICGNVLDADFHSIQGITYIYLNQLEKANEVLLEGLAIDPSNVDILFNLGYLNSLVGNFNIAIDYYITAKDNYLNPDIKLQIEQQLAEIDKIMIKDEKPHVSVISKEITEELIESVRTVEKGKSSLQTNTTDILLLDHYKFNLAIYGTSNLSIYLEEILDTQKARVVIHVDKESCKKNSTDYSEKVKTFKNVNSISTSMYDYLVICIDVPGIEDELEKLGVDKNKIINLWKLLEEYLSKYMKIYFSNYSYNYLNSKINKAKSDLSNELFITGLSYPMKGINEYLLPKRSVKLTSSSQDLYYDYQLAKKLLSNSHNFKYCILGLAYYSFSFDVAKTSDSPRINSTFYPIVQELHGHILPSSYQPPVGIERISELVTFNNPIIDTDLCNKCLENVFKVDLAPVDEQGWNRPCEDLPIEQLGHKRALFHSKFNFKTTISEYREIFGRYLDLLKQHDVIPIIVIFPTTSYYNSYFNEDIRNTFYSVINEFKCEYKFQFFDFFYSRLFGREDFADCDHLNQRGADKMTKILSEVINWD